MFNITFEKIIKRYCQENFETILIKTKYELFDVT